MRNIARVIVDVPTMQTNHPFDYDIPENLINYLEVGMRVVVPFGFGSRLVQGFVVEITNQTSFEKELKGIESIMDLEPVLNTELLDLAHFMSQNVYAFLITCLQTMLPSVLRASYKKFITKIDDLDPELEAYIFEGRDEISWQEAEERNLLSQLVPLKKQGKLGLRYEVKDKRSYKTVRYLRPLLSFEEIEEEKEGLSSRAKKQARLLDFLQQLEGEDIEADQLKKNFAFTNQDFYKARDKGWLKIVKKQVFRDPYRQVDIQPNSALELSQEQEAAFQAIMKSVDQEEAETFLLQGVTGSGKTEVYLQVIAQVLEKEQTALVLVPEISLTPLMVNRFKSRFGDRVAVMHSGLSDGERYDEWRRVMLEEADVVVGARSSVFAPLKNLGVIIIDEEHEESYKQNENPRYHAIDIAKWRSNYHQCPLVLASATPSLESRSRASKNRYQLLEMKIRPTGQSLPSVHLVDLKEEARLGNFGNFSQILLDKIRDRLSKDEQVVLMLNRRGYSSFVMCRDCGYVLQCPNCDIAQTLHMDSKTMKCHYCGHEEAIPNRCKKCQSTSIRYYGTGTQKVEEELIQLIPEATIIRMDRDTTRRKGDHEKLLNDFGQEKAQILLGTQMIAKGLDFPKVTLVGVLNADTSLNLPDFRSSEKTFQLLTQVSGRAGRGDKAGEVYIQSYNPDHYAIQLAKNQDYDFFYRYEMRYRHQGQYPPYYFIVRISVSHKDERQAYLKIHQLNQEIRPCLSSEAIVLGPSPTAIARTNNKYHYQMLIKYRYEDALQKKLHYLLENNQKEIARGLSIIIDPEPRSFI